MKVTIVLLCSLALGGCVRKLPPQEDTSEILIQHLMRRVSDLSSEVQDRQNDILKHDNNCLSEEIAALEGRPTHRSKQEQLDDAVAKSKAFSEGMIADLNRGAQNALDGEAAIEEHNRKHPEAPWADSKDLLRLLCGDCAKERAFRDSQLQDEARRPNPSPARVK